MWSFTGILPFDGAFILIFQLIPHMPDVAFNDIQILCCSCNQAKARASREQVDEVVKFIEACRQEKQDQKEAGVAALKDDQIEFFTTSRGSFDWSFFETNINSRKHLEKLHNLPDNKLRSGLQPRIQKNVGRFSNAMRLCKVWQ